MSSHDAAPDRWELGAAYQRFMGRWSDLLAVEFLRWLNPSSGLVWLDVGCGAGALTQAIADRTLPRHVTGLEPSAGFAASARRRLGGRADIVVGSIRDVPADRSHDMIVSGLVLNFLPDPDRAMQIMQSAARPGATVAGYVWDYADRMHMLRRFWDVAIELAPGAAELDEATRFPLCRRGELESLLSRSELESTEVVPIEITTRFSSFADFWEPFTLGQGPAPSYVASLPPRDRDALQTALAASLGGGSGGFDLIGGGWALRGVATG